MKNCAKCKESLSLDSFNSCKTRKDGKDPYCKGCCKAYRTANRERLSLCKKEYLKKNKAIINKRQREYYYSHKELVNSRNRIYLNNPISWAKRMLRKSAERAAEAGMEHTILLDDIHIPEKCPYLGTLLTFTIGSGQLPTNASLDRIDSSIGYIKDNIQVISRLANTMKSNATAEQLHTFALSIMKHYTAR